MTRRRRLRTVFAVLGAGASLGIAATALAHLPAFDSRVTMHEVGTGPTYRGRVISKADRCERHRTVSIYSAQPGPDVFLFDVETNGQGRWEFTFSGDGYYAVVHRVTVGPAGQRRICRGDRSPTT